MDTASALGATLDKNAAFVLFSGGQDSTTVLAWALSKYKRVETIGFEYGQKHFVELERRLILREKLAETIPAWRKRLGPDHLVKVDLIGQIAKDIEVVHTQSIGSSSFPGKRYIPGRNLIMLSMSASVALRRGIGVLGCGVSETEYSGYPDCRRRTILAVQRAINESSGLKFKIQCPLMKLNKAGVWRMANVLGSGQLVDIIRRDSHTCYEGVRDVLHDWGYGCSRCDACRLREKGWREFIRD
jgi:7-cyano-7-deazaguanine synthase